MCVRNTGCTTREGRATPRCPVSAVGSQRSIVYICRPLPPLPTHPPTLPTPTPPPTPSNPHPPAQLAQRARFLKFFLRSRAAPARPRAARTLGHPISRLAARSCAAFRARPRNVPGSPMSALWGAFWGGIYLSGSTHTTPAHKHNQPPLVKAS